MSTKYTPAPWSFVEESGDCKLKNSSGETMMCDMSYYPWTPDSKEDWQLIAAAPELLEALQLARKELHACQAVIHLHGGFDPAYVNDAQKALKIIDAVITKALGETK